MHIEELVFLFGKRRIDMKKRTKRIVIICGSIVVVPIVFVGGYITFMSMQYYRIEDNIKLDTQNQQAEKIDLASTITIATYNIGFGAYNQDFSFFMDSGTMKDGKKVQGAYGRAQSEDIVQTNMEGSLGVAKHTASDFYFFQEVDRKATRSFDMNQYEMIKKELTKYGSVYTDVFHSAYLLYPFHEPHGSVESGLVTLSRYQIVENIRRQYPIDNSFITKFTDLDRAFTLSRLEAENGKELVLINSHMSAYDKGGTIRKQQLERLNKVLHDEYKKGNYVVVGGDFNHDIAQSKHTFATTQEVPEWIYEMKDEDLATGFHRVIARNAKEVPTCRSSDMPYEKGVNYTAIVDGFIVSDNIQAEVNNIDTQFMYSDHNPVQMSFTLLP